MGAAALIPGAVLGVLLSGTAPAQEILWQRVGADGQYQFRGLLARSGDADGDGYPEILCSMGVLDSLMTAPTQELWVLSGRDGHTLRTMRPPPPYMHIATTEAGDMDGDGIDDYAVTLHPFGVGPPPPALVEVRSGLDDRLLWSVQGDAGEGFGKAILGGLDLDGNDRPDLVVTVPQAGPALRAAVLAYDHEGSLLWSVQSDGNLFFGESCDRESIGRVGDLNGDGADDFVLGGGFGGSGGGGVVLSGSTGAVLQVGVSPLRSDNLGTSVDGCGDLDGDGVPDFVAGNRPFAQRGVVMAFSGATGEVLRTWTSVQFGLGFDGRIVHSDGADLDRDGVPDILVGAWGIPAGGGFFAFSGRDEQVIHRVTRAPGNVRLGASVAVLGQVPGSPFGTFAVTDPESGGSSTFLLPSLGQITVYRGAPAGASAFGEACAGTLESAPKIGMRSEAGGARITLHDAPPGALVWLLVGTLRTTFAGLPLPRSLDDLGFRGCALLTSVEATVLVDSGSQGPSRGFASVVLPGVPAALGMPLHAQWLVLRAGGGAPGGLSDALLWHVP